MNDVGADHLHSQTIFSRFERHVLASPDNPAIVTSDLSFTYRELHSKALEFAVQLSALPVSPERPVAFLLPEGPLRHAAILGAARAGRICINLDIDSPERWLAGVIEDSGSSHIVADAASFELAQRAAGSDAKIVRLDAAMTDLADAPMAPPPAPNAIASIVYTSGSAGRPKGVVITHEASVDRVNRMVGMYRVAASDRFALAQPTSFAAGLNTLLTSLLSGGRLYPFDVRTEGLQNLSAWLNRHDITILRMTSSLLRSWLSTLPEDCRFPKLRIAGACSEPLYASDIARIGRHLGGDWRVVHDHSATEVGIIAYEAIDANSTIDDGTLPVGRPVPGVDIRLEDEAGILVPPETPGEIVVKSRFLALGYWNDPVTTEAVFGVDSEDGLPTYRTGDLGRWREDGRLEQVGRKSRKVKVRGHGVELREVECALLDVPGVRDAAVTATDAGPSGLQLVAYAVTDQAAGSTLTGQDIRVAVAKRLPQYMVPTHVIILDSLPLTSRGKIDRDALPPPRTGVRHEAGSSTPSSTLKHQLVDVRTQIERHGTGRKATSKPNTKDLLVRAVVREAWQHRFGEISFAGDLSWDQSGGDSLKALEFILQLELRLDRRVPMALLGPATRPSDLIASLERTALASDQPELFFFPGFGEELSNMRFVQALGKRLQMSVIEYPHFDPLKQEAYDYQDIVTTSLTPLLAAARDGAPIRLIGYSFGGDIAFRCACQLASQGIDVEFLGIVDAPAIRPPKRAAARPKPSCLRVWAHRLWIDRIWTLISQPDYAFERLVGDSLRNRHFKILALTWRVLTLLRLFRALRIFQKASKVELRRNALKGPGVGFYPGRICVFRARDNWRGVEIPEDLHWSSVCAEAAVWNLDGDHHGIFRADHVDATAQAVFDALDRSGVKIPGQRV